METKPENKPKKTESPSVVIDAGLCKACGLCVAFCPRRVLSPGKKVNALGYRATVYDGAGCIGCGTCFYVCPEPGAVTVIRPARKRAGNATRKEPSR